MNISFNRKIISNICKKYNINTLYIFGSQVTGKAGRLSDYDFAVFFDDKIDKVAFFDLQIKIISELYNIVPDKKKHIDLVIMNDERNPLLLRFNVIRTGKVLYDQKKIKRVNREVRISRMWMDWQYYEELWSNIYLRQVIKGNI